MNSKHQMSKIPSQDRLQLSGSIGSRFSGAARYILFTILVFTPLARGSVQSWAITVIEMLTLLALTLYLLGKALTWKWKWVRTPLNKPILMTIILVLISVVFSLHRRTSIWPFILFLDYLVLFYLTVNVIQTRSQLRQLVYVIIAVATFLSVFGLLKKFGANPFPWWEYPELYKYYGTRLASTFGCPNHLAGYIEMSLPLLLGLFMFDFKPGIVFNQNSRSSFIAE